MAKVDEQTAPLLTFGREELEELFAELCASRPKDRIEIINGRIVVSPMPTRGHEFMVSQLIRVLMPVVVERGWMFSTAILIFLGVQKDRFRPDLTVMAPDAPHWGKEDVYGDATTLVAEVVSESSIDDDHRVKPQKCAAAGVPLFMVIDHFARSVRLLSQPNAKAEKYDQQLEVPFGAALELPSPWSLTMDTSVFHWSPGGE